MPPVSLLSVVFGPMNTEWSRIHEPHLRLKWARQNAGFTTATAAALSLGMKKDTYTAYEREPGSSKTTAMDHQAAMSFGKKYKVSWTWLLLGQGSPFERVVTEAQQRVIDAMARAEDADQDRVADAVEALLRRTGTDG